MQLEKREESKKFVTILADGKFHQQVPEGTEGAVVREYEDKEGFPQTKTELVFDEVSGKITKVSFNETEYGSSINVELDEDGIVSMGTASSFGEDFMKKFKSIDLSKEVKLVPYAFEAEGKSKKGVTVYQDDVKIESHYYDKETKKSINGMPEPEGDTSKFKSDDWKIHFIQVRKFLIKEIEEVIKSGF